MESLKEWATVVKALESGEQTVLLRKGGILDVASGFVIESKRFFLFPTFEHQDYTNIKPQFHKYLDIVKNELPEKGYNSISSYAEVVDERDILSQEVIENLSPFHIWSEKYINERRNWMPDKPIKAIFLRVYKIEKHDIPLKSEYQGCKSWININEEIPVGKPVLNDVENALRLDKFREAIK